jgi:hypothetical protein
LRRPESSGIATIAARFPRGQRGIAIDADKRQPVIDDYRRNIGKQIPQQRVATLITEIPLVFQRLSQERAVVQLQVRDQADVGRLTRTIRQLKHRKEQRA